MWFPHLTSNTMSSLGPTAATHYPHSHGLGWATFSDTQAPQIGVLTRGRRAHPLVHPSQSCQSHSNPMVAAPHAQQALSASRDFLCLSKAHSLGPVASPLNGYYCLKPVPQVCFLPPGS